MNQTCKQPAGLQDQDYAEQSEPLGHAYEVASAPRGINQHAALWVNSWRAVR